MSTKQAALPPHAGQPVATAGKALGESQAVMIMIHGRNASPRNVLDLVPVLQRPRFTYLAPAAAGNTWYPYSFMAESERNQPGINSGLSVINHLIEEALVHGVRKDHIALLGFSQGACLAAEFALRHADRFGGVIIFSGGLIGPPGTAWIHEGDFAGTPVFLGCSDIDSHVPQQRVDESAEVFAQMGAAVTKRIYPGMGHLVNEDEIAFAQAIMDQILS